MSRIVAILLGGIGAYGVLTSASLLTTAVTAAGGWLSIFFLPFFALLFSLAGLLAAAGLWRFRPWSWWVAAWYCIVSALCHADAVRRIRPKCST
jgi:hypothetical protein